jgi:Lipocalin-like domain
MKGLLIIVIITAMCVACKKDFPNMQSAQYNKFTGKWNIISVTVIPLDSTGAEKNNGYTITEPVYYYFQFNRDSTWTETLADDSNSDLGEHGTYKLHGDTSVTLININAPAKAAECRIVTLTNTSFTFKFQRATLFNGITPGYLRYIFQLGK